MRIQDVMTHPVETTTAGEPASAALERMRRKRIRHLVVKDGARIVGILSSHDMDERKLGGAGEVQTVGELMTPYAVKVRERTPLRRAANLMRGWNIGCLPVVDAKDHLAGIVTISDLLGLMGKGAEKPQRWILARRAPRRTPHPPV